MLLAAEMSTIPASLHKRAHTYTLPQGDRQRLSSLILPQLWPPYAWVCIAAGLPVCPSGYVQRMNTTSGAYECTACPNGTTSDSDADYADYCISVEPCLPGSYLYVNATSMTRTCTQCPSNAVSAQVLCSSSSDRRACYCRSSVLDARTSFFMAAAVLAWTVVWQHWQICSTQPSVAVPVVSGTNPKAPRMQ